MHKTLVLVGNPNCGKTTLFNALTGSNQYVGNWPGVTVERVIGKSITHDLQVVDLPGLYALSPYSPEEVVSRNYLLHGNYDVLVNVVDAAHLERSLSLTMELLQFKRPMVLAVNMMDLAKENEIKLDLQALEQRLGIPAVALTASSGQGLDSLYQAIESAQVSKFKVYSPQLESAIKNLSCQLQLLHGKDLQNRGKANALPQTEGEQTVLAQVGHNVAQQDKVYNFVQHDEEHHATPVCGKSSCCCGSAKVNSPELNPSFEINTNFSEQNSVTLQATALHSQQQLMSHHVNLHSNLQQTSKASQQNFQQYDFAALALLQKDRIYMDLYKQHAELLQSADKLREKLEQNIGTDTESYIAQERYQCIDQLLAHCVTRGSRKIDLISRKIDNVVTHKYLALPIFALIVYSVYFIAISTIGTMGTDYANDVLFGEYAVNGANAALAAVNAPEWLSGLIVDGVIGGVGAVLGFVPQMVVLFVLLSLLEQCGYMTRVAFVLDRIFRHFGLSGRVIIPMVVATGCGVPALMATNTIDNINEKRLSVLTVTFMPCSAKLPILAMIGAAFFPESTLVAPAVYFMALFAIAFTAFILKKDTAFKEEVSPFVMELPNYTLPNLRNVVRTTYLRCKAFVIKAGTVIFSTVVVIWFLSSFNLSADGLSMVNVNESMLAAVGSAIAFIFIPLGFASWQAAVAIFTGLLAKENVVGTLAVLLGMAEVAEDDAALGAALHGEFSSAAAAMAFLTFNLFSTPCVAALGAMKRQLNSKRLFTFAIVYLTLFAYAFALVVYQVVGLITGSVAFGLGSVAALAILAIAFYMLLRPERKNRISIRIPAKQI